jgi:hypothetical protein
MKGLAPAAAVLALLTALDYLPVFRGWTPLPMGLVLQFAPWQEEWQVAPRPYPELGDLVTEVYPWRAFAGREVQQGELPLWNPYVFLGAPFQAHPCSAMFDALNWLYYVLPAPAAWSLCFMLRAFLAGLFAFLFVRALGASPAGALAAGLAFGFSGFMLVWRGWPHADSALWLPLVCLGVHRLRLRPGPRAVALAAAAFALPLLGGHPAITLYVVAVGLAYAAFRLLWPPPGSPPARGRFVVLAGLAGVLALGLAAVQLLPSLEWIQATQRSPVSSARGALARPAWEIASLFYRDAGSNPNAVGMRVPEAVTYSGVLTVMAALGAALHRDRRAAAFWALVLLLAVQVVYGWGPLYWVSRQAPFVAAQNNLRVSLVICFALVTLAGLGFTALERVAAGERVGPAAWMPSLAGLLLGAAALAALNAHTLPARWPPGLRHGLPSSLVLLGLGAALLCPPVLRALGPRGFAAAALTLLAADVLSFGYGHVPFVPRAQIYPEAPVLRYLAEASPPPSRHVALDLVAPTNAVEMMYRLPSPTGYDVPLKRTYEVMAPLSMGVVGGTLDSATVAQADHRLLDLFNVKHLMATTWNQSAARLEARPDRFRPVYSRGAVRLFENLRVLPRALVVPGEGLEVVSEPSAVLARLASPGFDPTRQVIGDRRPPWTGPPAREPGTAGAVETLANEIRLTAEAPGAAVLVLSDTYYPGWKAWIDGRETEVLRVNHALKGVPLEAGRHQVRFRFDPWRFRVGAWVSAVTALVLIGLAAWPVRRDGGRTLVGGR